MKETDLYPPVRDFLEARGYDVQAEVKNCDITAVKGDDLIVIELKTRFSLDLLYQAADRQSVTDSVYMAVPGPVKLGRRSNWRKRLALCKRLELGLIAVTTGRAGARVEILHHPVPYQRRRLNKRRWAVLDEVAARSGSYNRGGSVGRSIMTAYRESAVFIACCLEKCGPLTPKALREMDAGQKTTGILYANHYKWFKRVSRGVYDLTEPGRKALAEYPELVERFRERLEDID